MDILSAIFRQQTRKIGLLVPSVIISEKHQDALEITEHPVEVGAAVNDHAYKRAAEVTMEVGFAGGGSLLDFVDTSTIGLSLGKSPEEVYQELRELQESREPFDVITGKRKYRNMLIRGIEVTTDKTSENVLMCVLTLREVIMSQTESVKVADKENMQEGVSTAAMQNTGTKAPAPANNSLLKSGLDWVTENFK
ncbi:phage baseplate protein [Yersinia sp. 2553 StPb PI]|uniref:phage baseplate protein n=1 Tax=Yersinia sp. 2553 StPb PI TaxID=3117411 RepID=UPI003FA476FF